MTIKSGKLILALAAGLIMAAPASAGIQCDGWVGPHANTSGSTPFSLRVDVDNSTQTVISGQADDVYALLIYFKDEGEADISISDMRTHATAGSHAGFNRAGILDTGFSLVGLSGQPERHVLFECKE